VSLADIVGGPPNQDYIVLAGVPSPGLAVVKGAGSPRKWDVPDAFAMTGANIKYRGEKPSAFDVDIFCWTDAHFLAWPVFARLTLAAPLGIGLPVLAMSIQHPTLNDPPLSISQVVVTNVSAWEQDPDGTGLWCRTISLLQYRKGIPVGAGPTLTGPPGSPIAFIPPVNPEAMGIASMAASVLKLPGNS
jgi:hypothetical protein